MIAINYPRKHPEISRVSAMLSNPTAEQCPQCECEESDSLPDVTNPRAKAQRECTLNHHTGIESWADFKDVFLNPHIIHAMGKHWANESILTFGWEGPNHVG
jgi:hypothetical protein